MGHKPSPGVCGTCGRAVVRPTPKDLVRMEKFGDYDTWVNGHHFVKYELVNVRCRDHEPELDWDTYAVS